MVLISEDTENPSQLISDCATVDFPGSSQHREGQVCVRAALFGLLLLMSLHRAQGMCIVLAP